MGKLCLGVILAMGPQGNMVFNYVVCVCSFASFTIVDRLAGLGFKYCALDLRGYRSGSMNELLAEEEEVNE